MVQLQTMHRQRVYQMTMLREQEQQVRQSIRQQQVAINTRLQSPQRVSELVARFNLELYPVGEAPERTPALAQRNTREGRRRN